MKVHPTSLSGLSLIEPDLFRDSRGHFLETWQSRRYAEAGLHATFVLDAVSSSRRGVLRGLHYQCPQGQAKLLYVAHGAVFDVVVDLRVDSPTFGAHRTFDLSADNGHQLYVPAGFAHGFVVMSEEAVMVYKLSGYYNKDTEHGVAWDDPDLAIAWPVAAPVLADKDACHPRLREVPREALPRCADSDL